MKGKDKTHLVQVVKRPAGQCEGAGDQAVQHLLLGQGRVQEQLLIEQTHRDGDAQMVHLQLAQNVCKGRKASSPSASATGKTKEKEAKLRGVPELTAIVSSCSTGSGNFVSHRAATCEAVVVKER